MQAQIELRKKRSVSEMVSEVFNYLKIHIWNLFKALLIIVGPFYLVGSIFIGQFYGNMFSMLETNMQPDASSMLMLIPAFLLMIVGSLFFQGVIVGYMNLSLKLTKEEITLGLVFEEVKKHFWNYLGANVLFMIGFFVVAFLLGLLIAVIPVIGVFMFLIGFTYMLITFSLFPFIIGIENMSITAALSKSFQLIKGNWWRSFGYYILISIIQSFMASIVMMPVYFIAFFKIFSTAMEGGTPDMGELGIMMSIIMPIMMFISLFFYSFTGIAFGINYFSLVEQKEEIGLKEKIEEMNAETNQIEP